MTESRLSALIRRMLGDGRASQAEPTEEDPDQPEPRHEAIDDQSKYQEFATLLQQHDGRMKQSEVVAGTEWSQATVSRVLSEMAEDGIIRKITVGRQNLITLVGKEPDWYTPPTPTRDPSIGSSASTQSGDDNAILLVEDDQAEARLFQEALREADVTASLHVVQDGSDAVEFVLQRGPYEDAPSPAVVLLDLSLKLIDGIDVLREFGAHDAVDGIPVIVLSNSKSQRDIRDAYAHGAAGYVVKPDSLAGRVDLVAAIDSFWLTYIVTPDVTAGSASVGTEGPSVRQPPD